MVNFQQHIPFIDEPSIHFTRPDGVQITGKMRTNAAFGSFAGEAVGEYRWRPCPWVDSARIIAASRRSTDASGGFRYNTSQFLQEILLAWP